MTDKLKELIAKLNSATQLLGGGPGSFGQIGDAAGWRHAARRG